jgi:hypothetical protein
MQLFEMKNRLLAFAAIAEVVTGLALIAVPSLVVKLLFGTDVAGVAVITSQFAGLALLALGVACWPPTDVLCGMLTYTSLATLGLVYLGLDGRWVGPLLWPAVVLHAVLTLFLARAWFKVKQDRSA